MIFHKSFRLSLAVLLLLLALGCDSSDKVFEEGLPEENYKITLEDGSVVDKRTSLYPSEGPEEYSFKGQTQYTLTPFSDIKFAEETRNVVSFKKYITQLAPSYIQYSFLQGEVLRVSVMFRGLKASNSGLTSVTGIMRLKNSEGATLFETQQFKLHNSKPLERDQYSGSSQPVSFQIPTDFKPGVYTIHFDIHDDAYGIDVPLRADITVVDLNVDREQRVEKNWSAGWENEGAPFQLFMTSDLKVIDYLASELPRKTFYEYAVNHHLKSVARGKDIYAAIAFTNPTANSLIGGCNIEVSYFLYDQGGAELLNLKNGTVCKKSSFSSDETTLGQQRFATNFSTATQPGEYLLVAQIRDVASGRKYELGQKFAVK